MMDAIRRCIRRAADCVAAVIWPRGVKCLCCDEPPEGGFLCADCASELERLRLHGQAGDVRSVWAYRGSAKRLVLGLKLDCMEDCAAVLARGMADAICDMCLPPETVLTWVTMPEKRRRVRGIDHGRVLCEAIAEKTGLPVRQLLVRTRRVRTQRGLSGDKRRRNLTGSFRCDGPVHAPVLLIDDVLTTGATTETCRQALREAGAPCVFILTATCVRQRDND